MAQNTKSNRSQHIKELAKNSTSRYNQIKFNEINIPR